MHFSLSSKCKLCFRSLKTDLLENSVQGEDFLKLCFLCLQVNPCFLACNVTLCARFSPLFDCNSGRSQKVLV